MYAVSRIRWVHYYSTAVVICTGVYLNSKCIYGDVCNKTGPNGLSAANYLTSSLMDSNIIIRRFKTGTPARIDKNSIDFSKMEEQKGDDVITPFSFTNSVEDINREQISCWLTYTNNETHEIIKGNIERSPLYSGVIEGTQLINTKHLQRFPKPLNGPSVWFSRLHNHPSI